MDSTQASLAALPAEIVEFVAEHLDLPSLRVVRLTCKALEEKTSHLFGHKYFTTICTNLSLKSIQALDSVSRSALVVRHVQAFRLDRDEEAGVGIVWDRDATGSIRPDSAAIQQVRDIILRCPNCRSLHIGGERGDGSPLSSIYKIKASDMLGIGFILISETSLALNTLKIWFGDEHGHGFVKPSQAYLGHTRKPTFRRALSSVVELSLNVYASIWSRREGPNNCDWVWGLVSDTIRMQKLEWSVNYNDPFRFETTGLSYVRELMIRHMNTSANLIEILGQCSQCLRSLTLERMFVDQGWRDVFQILERFDNLEHISFYLLMSRGLGGLDVFNGLEDRVKNSDFSHGKPELTWGNVEHDKRGIIGVKYSGSDTQAVIEMLFNVMAREWEIAS